MHGLNMHHVPDVGKATCLFNRFRTSEYTAEAGKGRKPIAGWRNIWALQAKISREGLSGQAYLDILEDLEQTEYSEAAQDADASKTL